MYDHSHRLDVPGDRHGRHEPHCHEGHGHGHHGHRHAHHHAPNNKKGLAIALSITSGIMLLEFAGGF